MATIPVREPNYKTPSEQFEYGEITTASFSLTRRRIIDEAIKWRRTPYRLGGNSRHGIDCSHFVWQVYCKNVNPAINENFFTSPANDHLFFNKVSSAEVKKGDLIVWGMEHIGIIVEPKAGIFIGAQSSTGVAEANYKQGHWAGKAHYFLQYKYQDSRP